MIQFINITFLVLDSILATMGAVLYLLNLFKKKSLLSKIDGYGSFQRQLGLLFFIIFGVLAGCYYAVDEKFLYGLSLGAQFTLFIIMGILSIVTIEAISTWFNNIPET